MKTGSSVIFHGSGKEMDLQMREVSALRAGEILVKNEYTTLCGSDLHTFCGIRKEAVPVVLGHEIVGRIVEINSLHSGQDHSGRRISPGDRITWSIFSSDPRSVNSLNGIPQKGSDLFKYGHAQAKDNDIFNGGLSEYCILKAGTGILKIPAELPLPIAATINCSVSTVAGAMRLAGDVRSKRVVIFGMGMLGMTCAAMCREAGADWIGAVDISEHRLNTALGYEVDEIFNSRETGSDLVPLLKEKLPGQKADVVFDMSGSSDAMESGISLLAIGGMAVWVGAVFDTRKVQIDPQFVVRNLITIKGLHNYNFEDFTFALDFMEKNWQRYPFTTAVEKEFTLADSQRAFEYAVKHKPLRVGIRIDNNNGAYGQPSR